ncbi:leucine-rich repeat and fibronectin type III domain-containing protein 1-like [Branchiostoma lanceolatum]|uniref:leucine-rich repeat and fibronectin type III domain-containing protein 1-like n=1 Tax=Branchiostoma lanceolatum TaxID=7740 RepID=UPI003456C7B7
MKTAANWMFKSRKRRQSRLPLLALTLCLWLVRARAQEGHALPEKCEVTSPGEKLKGVPADAATLDLQRNQISNLTDIPALKSLTRLYLQNNRIETVDWESLGNLPALVTLSLKDNRLTHVSLDLAIKKMPDLTSVHLQFNQLRSFTKEQLGHPTVRSVKVGGNPLDCSCPMMWMVNDLKCLHNCATDLFCCDKCDACLLSTSESHECATPDHLKGLSLTSVARSLTGCDEENLVATTAKTTGQGTTTKDQGHGTTTELFEPRLEEYKSTTSPSNERQDSTSPTAIDSDHHKMTAFQPNAYTQGRVSTENPPISTPSLPLETQDFVLGESTGTIPPSAILQASTIDKSNTPGFSYAPTKTSLVSDQDAVSQAKGTQPKTHHADQDGGQANGTQLETPHSVAIALAAVFAIAFLSALIIWKVKSRRRD